MLLLLAAILSMVAEILTGPAIREQPACLCTEEQKSLTNLWRINTRPPSYLFGTIHVPYSLVWDEIANNSKTAFLLADKVYFELDLTNTTEETKGSIKVYFLSLFSYLHQESDGSDCQELPDSLTISEVLSPDLNQRLVAHLAWVREEMASWLTEDQRDLGLNSTFVFSALTEGWDKKRPLWLRKELNLNLNFMVGRMT